MWKISKDEYSETIQDTNLVAAKNHISNTKGLFLYWNLLQLLLRDLFIRRNLLNKFRYGFKRRSSNNLQEDTENPSLCYHQRNISESIPRNSSNIPGICNYAWKTTEICLLVADKIHIANHNRGMFLLKDIFLLWSLLQLLLGDLFIRRKLLTKFRWGFKRRSSNNLE